MGRSSKLSTPCIFLDFYLLNKLKLLELEEIIFHTFLAASFLDHFYYYSTLSTSLSLTMMLLCLAVCPSQAETEQNNI